jgi:hypothetical protein
MPDPRCHRDPDASSGRGGVDAAVVARVGVATEIVVHARESRGRLPDAVVGHIINELSDVSVWPSNGCRSIVSSRAGGRARFPRGPKTVPPGVADVASISPDRRPRSPSPQKPSEGTREPELTTNRQLGVRSVR